MIADMPLTNYQSYLDQRPEIVFVYRRTYKDSGKSNIEEVTDDNGVFKAPQAALETLNVIDEEMALAIEALVDKIPQFWDVFSGFDPREEISAPYLFMYYISTQDVKIQELLGGLPVSQRELLQIFLDSIPQVYSESYAYAAELFDKGVVSRNLLRYLVQLGDILLSSTAHGWIGYKATSWPNREHIGQSPTDLQRGTSINLEIR